MMENLFFSDSPLEHHSNALNRVHVVGKDGKGWTSQMLFSSVSPWIGDLMSSLPLHTDHCIILPDVAWKEVSSFFHSLKLSWSQDGPLVELFNIAPTGSLLGKDEETFQLSDKQVLSIHSGAQIEFNEYLDENIKKGDEDNLLEAEITYIKNEELSKESENTTLVPKDNKISKVECELCGKQFSVHSDLEKLNQNLCKKCNKGLLRILGLKCEQCGKQFSTKFSFKRHKERAHGHKKLVCKKVTCIKCHRTFASELNFERHKLTAKENCDKIQSQIIMPPIKPVKPRKNKYKMSYIRKILRSPGVDFYNLEHMMQGTKLISCDECEKRCITSKDLRKHKIKFHALLYKCNYCDFSGKRKYLLIEHHEENHKEISISQCDLCNKICSDYNNLQRHKQLVHEGIRFPCEECDYKAPSRSSLTYHINAIHKKLTLACDKCDKKYTHPRNLRQHQKSEHEGIFFLCDQCDYKAPYKGSQKRSLQNHIKKCHNETKQVAT